MAALHLNAADVARIAAVDAGTVSDFLRGKRWPTTRTRARIEAALQWPPGRLEQLAEDPTAVDEVTTDGEGGRITFQVPRGALDGLTELQIEEALSVGRAAVLRALSAMKDPRPE